MLSKYQHEGNYGGALQVIDRLAVIGTKGGQQVQMFALLRRLTPEGSFRIVLFWILVKLLLYKKTND